MPNEKWWGNKPKLDKIVYKQMADTASLNAFQNGEIDAVEASTKDDIKAIRSVKDAQLRIGYSTKTRVLEYNGKSKPLDDLQVRKAITQAFDVNTYNNVQFQGLNWKAEQPGSELLLPFQKGYENNLPAEAKYNVDNAKKPLRPTATRWARTATTPRAARPLRSPSLSSVTTPPSRPSPTPTRR